MNKNRINHHFSSRLAACHRARPVHAALHRTMGTKNIGRAHMVMSLLFPRYHGIVPIEYHKMYWLGYCSVMVTDVRVTGVNGLLASPEGLWPTGVVAIASSVARLAESDTSIEPKIT
jgi:hypothetical protein